MAKIDQRLTENCPIFTWDGRRYSMHRHMGGWRIRSRTKRQAIDFYTPLASLVAAKKAAREWFEKRKDQIVFSKRGGGSLAALSAIYIETPKHCKEKVAKDNAGRLKVICQTLGKEIRDMTCREVSPDFWQRYQRAAIERAGYPFDLVTRRRENIGINSAVRAARCLFLPQFSRIYRAEGLDVRPDAGEAVMLPEPYLPPAPADDVALLTAWEALADNDPALWMAVGLARFAGLRREEISHCRVCWIEIVDGAVYIALRDRLEEQWWTKTGKPYRAQVIHPQLAEHLTALADFSAPDKMVADAPPTVDRADWFARGPQRWLREHGISGNKPLHRLRGLYADHIAKLTRDAVTARLASIRAAQKALGHTSSTTTEDHYLSEDALR